MADSTDNPIDEIATEQNATLDRVLRAAPSTISDADLDATIAKFRKERTLFIITDEDKKGKKRAKGSGDTDDTTDDE